MGKKKCTIEITTTCYEKLKEVAKILGLSVEDYIHQLVADAN